MSREERRQYQRQMKGQDPYAPAPRSAPRRRPPPRPKPAGEAGSPRTFWVRTIGSATVVGILAFSLAWPNGMPVAAYVGLAAGVATILLVVAGRAAWRRSAGRRPPT